MRRGNPAEESYHDPDCQRAHANDRPSATPHCVSPHPLSYPRFSVPVPPCWPTCAQAHAKAASSQEGTVGTLWFSILNPSIELINIINKILTFIL
eukprot:scaffold1253_cov245-Pinguiococcus_pyrenoidosus.AAC.12